MVKQKKVWRSKKNIAGQVLTYNSKNFHWLNRKLDLERTMNGLGKPFRKKSDPKNRKNSKHQSEIAACEQKTTSEKSNFCSNTVFWLYFKFRAKKFHTTKPLAFSLHFLFRRDQNHYSNSTSKIMKMCEQILKKNIAGRIPETTRSENPFKRHPTTHQTKRAFTNLWLSWNKDMKQKSKNNKIKSVKIW